MTTSENKDLTRRMFEEVWNEKRPERIEAYYAADFLGHGFGAPEGDLATYKAWFEEITNGFPDIEFTLGELLAEDDMVAVTWVARATHKGEVMGFEPTDAGIEGPGDVSGISVHRVEDGKIVEAWMNFDSMRMLQNMGVLPRAESATA